MKQPNNISDLAPCEFGLSQKELDEIRSGSVFPAWKFIPWVFEALDLPLAIRPPPPEEPVEEPNVEEMSEEEKAAYLKEKKKKDMEEAKRIREEEDARKAKEERRAKRAAAIEAGQDLAELGLEESEEEEIKVDDLSIDEFILEPGAKADNFILLNFPHTEENIKKLKEHDINFDRIIFLNELNEEEPGKVITQRMIEKGDRFFDYETESAKIQNTVGLVKEHIDIGEDNFKEIECTGTEEEVFIRIKTEIDPFFTLTDVPDDVPATADLDEEARRLPKGDFGDYCPVTYVNQNFLVKGNPEFESSIMGKTYLFAGEKE